MYVHFFKVEYLEIFIRCVVEHLAIPKETIWGDENNAKELCITLSEVSKIEEDAIVRAMFRLITSHFFAECYFDTLESYDYDTEEEQEEADKVLMEISLPLSYKLSDAITKELKELKI